MKNEIMSKAEVSAFTSLFLGLVGYSVFMYYLLAKRSKGINYVYELYSINKFVVYFLFFLLFLLEGHFKNHISQKIIYIGKLKEFINAFRNG
ncbi:hypothetical protein, partial [Acinetobacter baumannii]|uniref:hypothetical protein n=1 Tax=Acinetobacter baumannii TaxID=470 RepID=UPI0038B5007C